MIGKYCAGRFLRDMGAFLSKRNLPQTNPSEFTRSAEIPLDSKKRSAGLKGRLLQHFEMAAMVGVFAAFHPDAALAGSSPLVITVNAPTGGQTANSLQNLATATNNINDDPVDPGVFPFVRLMPYVVLNKDLILGPFSTIPAGSQIAVRQLGSATPNYARFDIIYVPPNAVDPISVTVGTTTGDLHASAINPLAYVVGTEFFATTNQNSVAFIWTPGSGITQLGTLDGNASNLAGNSSSSATALNADGTAVVGYSSVTVGGAVTQHAVRWSSIGIADLGSLAGPGGRSEAVAISNDGTVVAGTSDTNIVAQGLTASRDAFRWTLTNATTGAGALTDLGALVSGGGSAATAISGDGGTIVGYAGIDNTGSGVIHASLWNTSQTGPKDLGTVTGLANSRALAVSANGAVVVGTAYATLNPLAQPVSYSLPDFAFIGGNGYPVNATSVATRYTTATGMQDLNALLTGAGVNLGGMQLLSATSITQDGQFIGGISVPKGSPQNAPTQSFVARYIDAAVVVTPTPTPTPTVDFH